MMPTWFAFVALGLWPLVALYLYLTRPAVDATLWTVLGAFLLLPVGVAIKIDMVPPFDKYVVSNVSALIGCFIVLRPRLRFWHGIGATELLLLVFLITPFITSELNSDPIVTARRYLPGETQYDALSAIANQFLFIIPFLLGRELWRGPADLRKIFHITAIAGLAYSAPVIFELRMSPQLHNWLYGYHASGFDMAIRESGYRPMVFMGHGLVVSFFMMTSVVAATVLWKTRKRIGRIHSAAAAAYLGTILFLCKSLASLLYGLVLVVLVRYTGPKFQIRVAIVIAVIALSYPVLRSADLVPNKLMVEMASTISLDRAGSLKTRFDQEQQLLDRASLRLWFGWGRWGRNRVYDEDTGQDISLTDGHWIITLGMFGLAGFLAEFGLLALPVFRAASAFRFAASENDRAYLAALALVVAVSLLDLLPNSFLTAWTWLIAGALLGHSEWLKSGALQRGNIHSQPYLKSSAVKQLEQSRA
jgi:hypothetical protein